MSIAPFKLLRISLSIAIAAISFHSLSADEAPPPGSSRVYLKIAPNQKGNAISQIARAGGKVHHEFDNIGAVAATLPDQAINALRNSNSVLAIESDPVRTLNAETTPYGIPAIQADLAVTAGTNGAGVVVGVIDSGIYPAHEDFAGSLRWFCLRLSINVYASLLRVWFYSWVWAVCHLLQRSMVS